MHLFCLQAVDGREEQPRVLFLHHEKCPMSAAGVSNYENTVIPKVPTLIKWDIVRFETAFLVLIYRATLFCAGIRGEMIC